MGQAPSECNGKTCSQCKESLPSVPSFHDISIKTLYGREVYVYLKGRYYRFIGEDGRYLCSDCFFKTQREREERERRERERKKVEDERRRREEQERKRREQRAREEAERKKKEEERKRTEQQEREEAERKQREQNQHEGERKSENLLSNYISNQLNEQISSQCQKDIEATKYYTVFHDEKYYTSHNILPIDSDLFYYLQYNERTVICEKDKFKLSEHEDPHLTLLLRFFPVSSFSNGDNEFTFNIQCITTEQIFWVGLHGNGTELLSVSSSYDAITVTVIADSTESVKIFCKNTETMIQFGSDSSLIVADSSNCTSFQLHIATNNMCGYVAETSLELKDSSSSEYPDIAHSVIMMPFGTRIENIPHDLKTFLKCVTDLLESSWKVCPPSQDYLDWLLSVLLDLYIRLEEGKKETMDRVSQILTTTVAELIGDNPEDDEFISFLQVMCRLCSRFPSSKERDVLDFSHEQIQQYPFKFLDDVIGVSEGLESSWRTKCFKIYVKGIFTDKKEWKIIFEYFFANLFQTQLWPNEHIWSFAKIIKGKTSNDYDTLLQSLNIVLSNQIKDHVRVSEIFESFRRDDITKELLKLVQQEKDKDIDEVLQELLKLDNLPQEIYDRLKMIINSVSKLLTKFGYPLGKCVHVESLSDLQEKVEYILTNVVGGAASMSLVDQDLSKTLAIMACSVNKFNGYWPRVTQMTSWVLLAMFKDHGIMLEISTGEGKSCIIAMFAAMLANQGKYVDIVTSSSILANRDAEGWRDFYEFCNVTVGSNINIKDDEDRRSCYQSHIVFGTVASFAADILRQDFQQKQIRGQRRYDSVIVDEVDFMLLDRGVQFTYLTQQVAGMRHLDPVLAMIWNLVSSFTAVELENGTVLFKGYPQPFYRTILDFIDETTLKESSFPGTLQDFLFLVLQKAEKCGIIKEGYSQKMMNIDPADIQKIEDILLDVHKEDITKFLKLIGELLDIHFIPYISPDGKLLRKIDDADDANDSSSDLEIPIYVVDRGMCCNLLEDFEELAKIVKSNVLSRITYGETSDKEQSDLLPLPQNLEPLVKSQLMAWITNAFEATRMKEGRQYLVQGGNILPIDFRSTGMVELNKKWGAGLQQFLEMKHHLNLSPMSLITNFMSNIAFFQKYGTNIFGVSGTLGTETDKAFLQMMYNTESFSIPTHRSKKLFEVEGIVVESKASWCKEICHRLDFEVKPRWNTRGRAALVICEDINIANELCDEIKANVTPRITLYTRSETEEARALEHEFGAGKIIVATNLAGRGTDVQLSDEVNINGGMFVLLTFLPVNERVQRQAIGRTARKGRPGSSQMIILKDRLRASLQGLSELPTITLMRNQLEKRIMEYLKTEIKEVLLKEKLFSQYCLFLKKVMTEIVDEEEEKVIVEALNEKWGVWLKTKAHSISNLRQDDLLQELEKDMELAKEKCLSKKSPSRNVYHIIKFGNELLFEGKYKEAKKEYTDAIVMIPTWSTIAYYNRAYCTIILEEENYLQKAIDDLNCSEQYLENYTTEMYVVLSLLDNAKGTIRPVDGTSFGYANHVAIRENILSFYRKNIKDSIARLTEIKDQGRKAIVKPTAVFSLIPDADHNTQKELYEFWQIGLLQVFSVEMKPRFCWEGLIVALIGAVQIFAGACLVVVSCGSLTTVGTGLIGEGISDVIQGVVATLKGGNFDWKNWAIGKAIGIAASLIGMGVAKLFSKGAYMIGKLSKNVGNLLHEAKAITNMSRSTLKVSFSTVRKNIIQELSVQTVMYGIDSAEKEILGEIMDDFKERIRNEIKSGISRMICGAQMESYIERLVLHAVKHPKYVTKFSQNNIIELLHHIFQTNVLLPYSRNSELKQYLYSSLSSVRNELRGLKQNSKFGKAVFTAIDFAIDGAEVANTVATISGLMDDCNEKMLDALKKYCQDNTIPSRKPNIYAEGLGNVVATIEKELEGVITEEVTEFITGILEQTVSKTLMDRLKGNVNQRVNSHLRNRLGVRNTEEQLQAEANSRNIAYVSHRKETNASPISKSHKYSAIHQYGREVENVDKPGTLLDARILCESLGVKLKVMQEKERGKLVPKIETGDMTAKEQISVVYRKPSDGYPDGHYDVIIDGKIVEVNSKNKNCLFHAIAKSRNLNASDEKLDEISLSYRKATANELLHNYVKWNGFMKRQTITLKLYGGYEALVIGAEKKDVGSYRPLLKSSTLANVEHDHEPPVVCLRDARNGSNLGKAMFQAAHEGTRSVDNVKGSSRAPQGVAVRIPKPQHRAYLQTKYKEFRNLITGAISKQNEVDVFKYTFITSQTPDVFTQGSNYYSSQKLSNKKEENLEIVSQWVNKTKKHGYKFKPKSIQDINEWIKKGKFCDRRDKHVKEVEKMLYARKCKK